MSKLYFISNIKFLTCFVVILVFLFLNIVYISADDNDKQVIKVAYILDNGYYVMEENGVYLGIITIF